LQALKAFLAVACFFFYILYTLNMNKPALRIIEGGLPPLWKAEKEFVSAYITDTRLMAYDNVCMLDITGRSDE
jgi:hypothetical protein